jgi:hypothetical protein
MAPGRACAPRPSGACTARGGTRLVEDVVVGAVRTALADAEGRASAEAGIREAEQAAETAMKNYEAAMAALADFTDEVAVKRLRELRAGAEAAQARADRQGGQGATVTINGAKDWDRLTLDERRALIHATVERTVVKPGKGAKRVEVRLIGA